MAGKENCNTCYNKYLGDECDETDCHYERLGEEGLDRMRYPMSEEKRQPQFEDESNRYIASHLDGGLITRKESDDLEDRIWGD